ncbi:MAG: hypothetical protein LBR66_07480 [Candidatus Symbiothrix sp.]|nr:hypothetical protein [Candidatus Symbiothrix sp.]
MNIGYVTQTDPERVVSIAQGNALWKYVACHPESHERAQSKGLRPFRAWFCIIRQVRRALPYAIDERAFSPFHIR